MSAWMCSNRHFAFVAKAAEVHGLIPLGEAVGFARKLRAENIASLRYRYPNDWQELVSEGDDEGWEIGDIASQVESRGYVHKAVRCLDYQSCEPPEWDDPTNEVAEVVRKLSSITEVEADDPAFLAAPWGI